MNLDIPPIYKNTVKQVRIALGKRSRLLRFAQVMIEQHRESQANGLMKSANIQLQIARSHVRNFPFIEKYLTGNERKALYQGTLLPARISEIVKKLQQELAQCRLQQLKVKQELESKEESENLLELLQKYQTQEKDLLSQINEYENALDKCETQLVTTDRNLLNLERKSTQDQQNIQELEKQLKIVNGKLANSLQDELILERRLRELSENIKVTDLNYTKLLTETNILKSKLTESTEQLTQCQNTPRTHRQIPEEKIPVSPVSEQESTVGLEKIIRQLQERLYQSSQEKQKYLAQIETQDHEYRTLQDQLQNERFQKEIHNLLIQLIPDPDQRNQFIEKNYLK